MPNTSVTIYTIGNFDLGLNNTTNCYVWTRITEYCDTLLKAVQSSCTGCHYWSNIWSVPQHLCDHGDYLPVWIFYLNHNLGKMIPFGKTLCRTWSKILLSYRLNTLFFCSQSLWFSRLRMETLILTLNKIQKLKMRLLYRNWILIRTLKFRFNILKFQLWHSNCDSN